MMRLPARRAFRFASQSWHSGARYHAIALTVGSSVESIQRVRLAHRAFSTNGVNITFVDSENTKTTVAANEGQTLLDVAHENDIELEGDPLLLNSSILNIDAFVQRCLWW